MSSNNIDNNSLLQTKEELWKFVVKFSNSNVPNKASKKIVKARNDFEDIIFSGEF